MTNKLNIYKQIKNLILKQKYFKEKTTNLERVFPIEVIASTFENRILTDHKIVEDFWCFITNEEVNLLNINKFVKMIEEEIKRQYPDIKIYNYQRTTWFLTNDEVSTILKWYKENNGETIKIQSIKSGYTKTLKIQD